MDAGQLDVNIFAPPENFIAADKGFQPIFRQRDIAPDYPFHVFFATQDFIKNHPNTIKAVLRAVVKGMRTAKADKKLADKVLVDQVVSIRSSPAALTTTSSTRSMRTDGCRPPRA